MIPTETRQAARLRPAEPDVHEAWQSEDDEQTFADFVSVVVAERWLIGGVAAVALVLSLLYVLLATPRYRSDILVQVEEKQQGLGIEGLSDVFSGKVPAETEMELLRSRSLIGSVVHELGLDVDVRPRTFPLIGGAIYRSHSGDGLRSPPLGLRRFAWGGEQISIGRIDVPPELVGRQLKLVAGESGAWDLLGPDGEQLLSGHVGVAAERRGVALYVTALRARPGTEFLVRRHDSDDVIAGLQDGLDITEKGKKTGILQVALEGGDPRRVAATLDAVSRAYVRQNVDRKSAEAEKTLEFLETQLPELKARVEEADKALETYRAAKGSVDISLETQATVARSVELEKAMSELGVQRTELRQRFTRNHPLLASVQEKMQQVEAERAKIEDRLKRLPKAELESARLVRDAKVANELYVLLLNKAQELRVVKSGTVGNVRIVDSALVPKQPVSPRKAAAVTLSLALGLALGVGLALAKRALNPGVEDPEAIERETGLPVYASIPRSEGEARIDRADAAKVLATSDPMDVATESVRSLRTSLQFALVDSPTHVIAVLGPAPAVGKTFLSANLATIIAEGGKRVLLIDADLRKGRIHRLFGWERGAGLSELISGTAGLQEVVRSTAIAGLQVITTGRTPPNPAALLGSDRFAELIAEVARRYDHVVIDTSPVLAVTDAALVARNASVNLLVLRSGHHAMREITTAVKRLEHGGARVHGAVLNDVQVGIGHGRYHYQYAYRKAEKRR